MVNSKSKMLLPLDAEEFGALVSRCGRSNALEAGKRLHALIAQLRFHGRHSPTRIGNLLVDMYGKCGSAHDARTAFDAIADKNVFSWGFLIAAYASTDERFKVLREMCLEGVKPDKVAFLRLVRSCLTLAHGNLVRSLLEECGLSRDLQIATELLRMYGSLQEGRMAGNFFESLGQKDLVAWNAMIDAHAQCGQCKEAFAIYERMPLQADKVTYTTLLSCCDDLVDGEEIHACVVRDGIEWDVAMSTALVRCYSRCGNPEKAVAVFENFSGNKDVGMWTAMILCLSQNQKITEAIQVFREMEQQGFRASSFTLVALLQGLSSSSKSGFSTGMINTISSRAMEYLCSTGGDVSTRDDLVVATALVKCFGSHARINEAEEVFERFRLCRFDLVLWNAMVWAYAETSNPEEALFVLKKMDLEGGKADTFTLATVLTACATSCEHALLQTSFLHDRATSLGLGSDPVVVAALINSYSKSQRLGLARSAFEGLPTDKRDAVVWSSMIMGYARSGHIQDALEIFSKMDHPDKITIAQVLDAYADLACLSQCKAAHRDFVSPNQELESETMVANALVHMYAKCGSLDEARRVFDRMSLQSRNIVSWTAMISAYAQHGRSSESMELFQRMQQRGVEPNQVTFISILSSCSHSGLIDHAAYCFYSMEQDHSLVASQSHLVHMVDLLGRAGMLKHAQEIGESSSSRKSEELLPCAMVESLLGGCYTQGDREMASKIVGRALESPSASTDIAIDAVEFGALVSKCGTHASAAAIPWPPLAHQYRQSSGGHVWQAHDKRGAFDAIAEKNVFSWGFKIAAHPCSEEVDEAGHKVAFVSLV
ncbi:pentatricopeptide repeat-containing protein At5g27110 [Selaginella moellendorffii]|nr:pentatricopeptide repeat-containing protein At5g27110 [Selaginella moellendorffii]|eukprot:XP_002961545.2 pentatricopeptide repeat-containing protein At5g27110 [Selaginella moellendorffii]